MAAIVGIGMSLYMLALFGIPGASGVSEPLRPALPSSCSSA